jgi:hypothetical protein
MTSTPKPLPLPEGATQINNPSAQATLKNRGANVRKTRKRPVKRDSNELNKCDTPDKFKDISGTCNKALLAQEQSEWNNHVLTKDRTDYLYPSLNDNTFNAQIATKREFNDTQYEGIKKDVDANGQPVIVDVETYSDILSNAPFELQPHQMFVKNFLSMQTPYNSLLLYHGLGTGKTCSAIGVCEEQRDYLKQMGINKKIIIIAAPNVQDNFRLQLFDERKLQKTDGIWNIRSCTGNKLLKEINPANLQSLTKELIIKQINQLINTYYLFVGYVQFSNMVDEVLASANATLGANVSSNAYEQYINAQLNAKFGGSLIVIDEVHNIRIADDNPSKSAANNLMQLARTVDNLRFLLLSATPIYNNYAEIVWLINLMNVNDNRGAVEIRQIFDTDGNFLEDLSQPEGEQNVGERLFIKKCTGYISFVRGENPYTFPFRIYPDTFAPRRTFPNELLSNEDKEKEKEGKEENVARGLEYPQYQLNSKPISGSSHIIPLFVSEIGETQSYGYKCIIHFLTKAYNQMTNDALKFKNMESFGYTLLQKPIEALNIVYPVDGLKELAKQLELEASTVQEEVETVAVPTVSPEKLKEYKKSPVLQDALEEQTENIVAETAPEDLPVTKGDLDGGAKDTTSRDEEEDKEGPAMKGKLSYITGKSGLKYAMQFDGGKNANTKGNFEYRAPILKKYGRIFSPTNIGKYSAKIAQICKCISTANKVKGIKGDEGNLDIRVSNGIVLIYSQYIDSGLIPMALALEEMGFVRYGKDSKSLFKTPPPNTPVDVRTMLPRQDKEAFMPAQYVMITGDKRLSKNNDADVKAVTDVRNKDGNIIKVVLISTAGSEGIDLKFIRQVHIIDPWYNMNRIEQIIGRAVRNFSHKDLRFGERNVEIFLHGTMLRSPDENEEAVDLYVYRVAELKAVQIGKITRLLKETAVDCILNYEQSEFTQESFEAMGQRPVTQSLSYIEMGEANIEYKVGDVSYSAVCDYDKCDYKCINIDNENKLSEITKEEIANVTMTTYNERFIMTNADKIVQKVKDIFSNKKRGRHFFYKTEHLYKLINTPKAFPTLQIYAALSHLINDPTEIITDFYSRPGKLVNIGDYYLFQPAEFTSNNTMLSAFDRSTPVQYKPASIGINTEDRVPEASVHYTKDVHTFPSKFADAEDDQPVDKHALQVESTLKAMPVVNVTEKQVLLNLKRCVQISMSAMEEYQKLEPKMLSLKDLEEYSLYMKYQNDFRQGKRKENLTVAQNARLKTLAAELNTFKKGLKQIVEPEGMTHNDFVYLEEFQHKQEENKLTKNERKQFAELQRKYDNAVLLRVDPNEDTPFDNWYNYCGIALHKLSNTPFMNGTNPDKKTMQLLEKYVVEHAVDVTGYEEKLKLLNALQQIQEEDRDYLEDYAYKYMTQTPKKQTKIIKMGRREYLILYDGKTQVEHNYDDEKRKVLVLQNGRWELAGSSASKDFNQEVKKQKEEFKKTNLNGRINNLIGFIGYEKQGKQLLFKTKDITSDRNMVGARCDQSGKSEMLKLLNLLVGAQLFTEMNTKLTGQQEVCVTLELLFRYCNDIEKDGKIWFFSSESTELYSLEHCKIKNNKFVCQEP